MANKPKSYAGKDNYLFLSYCHKDSDFVYPFIEKLQDSHNVWYDEGIEYGSRWDEIVPERINNSSLFVIMFSNNSILSEPCIKELIFAVNKKIPFIGVMIDDCVLPDRIFFHFGDSLRVNAFGFQSINEVINDLINRCSDLKMVRKSKEKESAPEQPTTKEKGIEYYGGKKITIEGARTIFNKVSISKKDSNVYSLNSVQLKADNKELYNTDSFVGRGNIGCVFTLEKNPKIVAKVFYKEYLKLNLQNKIELMAKVEKLKTIKNITWPLNVLYDVDNNFAGYTMNCIDRDNSSFFNLYELLKNKSFKENAKKTDILDLLISCLENIKILHDNKIVLVDINLLNFVVKKSDFEHGDFTKVYIQSTDSFQVGQYQSFREPSSSNLPPEYSHANFTTYYRSYSWDYHLAFLLIFQLLLRKSHPYKTVNSTDIDYSILVNEGNFPYTLNEEETKNNVGEQAATLWSHLPYYVKKMFITTAQKGQSHYEPETRYTIKEWLKCLKAYKRDILSNRLKVVDDECNVGYPKKEIDYRLLKFEILDD